MIFGEGRGLSPSAMMASTAIGCQGQRCQSGIETDEEIRNIETQIDIFGMLSEGQ